MQGVQASSQFEMGLSSIASILTNMSMKTDDGNSFLKQINGDINTFIKDFNTPFLNISTRILSYNKMLFDNSVKTNDYLFSILGAIVTSNRRPTILQTFTTPDVISEEPERQENRPERQPTTNSDQIFNTISKNVESILKHLLKPNNSAESPTKTISSGSSTGLFDGFGTFAESIIIIKKNLTSALIKNLTKFGDAYNSLVEKNSNEKMKSFVTGIETFSESLTDLTKKLKEPAKFIGLLSLSFIILTLTVTNPLFGVMVLGIGAFIWVLTKVTNNKEFNPSIKDFAMGIALLSISLVLMNYVKWESVAKMIVFIAGLGLAFKTFNDPKTNGNKSMMYLAVGIGALAISAMLMQFVSWDSLAKMVIFIGTLGIALRFLNGPRGMGNDLKSSPMVIFALSIGILTLTMFAMNELPWEAIFKMVIFIGLLGFTMKLFNFNKIGPMNGMIQFSFGIGILVLAMFAINELPWEAIFKMIVFIGALGLTIRLINGRGVPPLISFAFGLGILVLAMYAMDELPWEAIFKTILFLGTLGLVLKLYGTTSTLQMIGIGIGIGALVLALKYFKDSGFSILDTLNFVAAIGGIGAVLAIIGIPAVAALVAVGAGVMILLSVALLISAVGFKAISELDIKIDNLMNYFKGVSIISIGFAMLSLFMIPALLGATLFIPIGVASLLGAVSLKLISLIDYNTGNIDNFIKSMKLVASGFADNALMMIPAAVGALLFLPVVIAALLGAGTLLAISKIDLDAKKLETYNLQVKSLVDNINSFGLIEIGKASIKAFALIPIFTAGYLGAALLQKISSVQLDKEKLGLFGNMMSFMVDTIIGSLAANESKMESAKPGLEALAKLLSVSKGLAETIQMMANLKFYEYGVENGKLVLKGVRQLTANDFKMVGVNLGIMLETLIAPLSLLGSNADMITIGGKTFANPFKNNSTLAGIEILTKLGNAYKPMAESIKTLADSGVMTDPALSKRFTDSLMSITAVYLWIFQKLSKIDDSLIYSSIGTITRFNNGFKNLPIDQITSVDTIFNRFINNLSDDLKWKKLRSNIKFMRMEFEAMTKSINSLNIEKATIFEKTVRNLIEKNNGQGLKEAAESLKSLLDLVEENKGGTQIIQQTNPISNPFSNPNIVATPAIEKSKKLDDKQNISDEIAQQLSTALTQIQNILSAIDTKLGGTLKTKNIAGFANTI